MKYMNLTNKQVNQIAKTISILDIKTYIEKHLLEYEHFLEEEKHKNDRLA